MNKTALIIGYNGQVGRAIAGAYEANGLACWRTSRKFKNEITEKRLYAELSEPASLDAVFRVLHAQPGVHEMVVYLCAAFTWVDGCEKDPERSRRDNLEAPLHVARLCREFGDKLVFFSSEYVFGEAEYNGGIVGPFRENDPVAPTSVYGEHKKQAETEIATILPDTLIVRTTTVFSYDPEGLNYAMQVYRFLKEGFAKGFEQKFRVPNDQISSPTHADMLANATLHLVKQKQSGIFHVVGKDTLSRAAFTERLIDLFGFDRQESLEQFLFLPTSELQQSARRPLTAGLDTTKAQAAGCEIWTLDKALAQLKQRMI